MRPELEQYFNEREFFQLKAVYDQRTRRESGLNPGANLREILPDEIVVEFDSVTRARGVWLATIAAARLAHHGYNFIVYDNGGRSPHLHIYNIMGLRDQNPRVRAIYKGLFFDKYFPYNDADSKLNTKSSSLIAVENRPHFKHGNIKKEVLKTTGFSNRVEIDLLREAIRIHDRLKARRRTERNNTRDYNWVINWVSSETLPTGSWNNIIAKNIAIIIINQKLDKTKVLERFNPDDQKAITGWFPWAEQEYRYVGFWEIKNMCESHDIDLIDKERMYRVLEERKAPNEKLLGVQNESDRHSKRGIEKNEERKVCNNVGTIQCESESAIFTEFGNVLW